MELRPRSLHEVIADEDIKSTIRNFINEQCRQWLFYGPTGTGKTTLALIVAREIQGPDFPADTEPDLLEINAANYTGVKDMRELIDLTRQYPMVGKYRVIILDEAHMLSEEAKTLLLKPLEEEVSTTAWILCTTDLKKLPKPLRDRCTAQFYLKGMGARERRELVSRAASHLGYTEDTAKFLRAIEEVSSARDILAAFERVYRGMPVEEAVGVV